MALMGLLIQCALMAAGTFAVGSIPLHLASSSTPPTGRQRGQSSSGGPTATSSTALSPGSGISAASSTAAASSEFSSSAISIYSISLLIGTALAVIIPEGLAIIQRSTANGKEGQREGEVHEHVGDGNDADVGFWIGLALCSGFLLMFCIHQYTADSHSRAHGHAYGAVPLSASTRAPKDLESSGNGNGNGNGFRTSMSGDYTDTDADAEAEARAGGSALSSQPGDYFSLASSSASSASSKTVTQHAHTHGHAQRRSSEAYQSADPLDSASPAFSTFIGLLFHALADGIALGAAASFASAGAASPGQGGKQGGLAVGSDDNVEAAGLSLLIFLSLIVHKAPVAFSLSSLLMSFSPAASLRTQKSHIRRALGVFALATPIGAIVTWLALRIVSLITWSASMEDGNEEDGNIEGPLGGNMRGKLEFWTGMALLFSAGTFLFVSTHVMSTMESGTRPTTSSAATSCTPGSAARSHFSEHGHSAAMKSRTRIGLFVAGMLTPLVLSAMFGHHHGH